MRNAGLGVANLWHEGHKWPRQRLCGIGQHSDNRAEQNSKLRREHREGSRMQSCKSVREHRTCRRKQEQQIRMEKRTRVALEEGARLVFGMPAKMVAPHSCRLCLQNGRLVLWEVMTPERI